MWVSWCLAQNKSRGKSKCPHPLWGGMAGSRRGSTTYGADILVERDKQPLCKHVGAVQSIRASCLEAELPLRRKVSGARLRGGQWKRPEGKDICIKWLTDFFILKQKLSEQKPSLLNWEADVSISAPQPRFHHGNLEGAQSRGSSWLHSVAVTVTLPLISLHVDSRPLTPPLTRH